MKDEESPLHGPSPYPDLQGVAGIAQLIGVATGFGMTGYLAPHLG
jgi:hypothetical protein